MAVNIPPSNATSPSAHFIRAGKTFWRIENSNKCNQCENSFENAHVDVDEEDNDNFKEKVYTEIR